MPLADIGRSAVQEEIYEVTKKIQLLEGGRKAFVENSNVRVKKNQTKIFEIREENKELHKRLARIYLRDNHVVDRALMQRPVLKAAYRRKPGSSVCSLFDLKILDRKKKLNYFKAMTVGLQQRFKDLQECLYFMETSDNTAPAKVILMSLQMLRNLENQLGKAQLKWQEARYINLLYEKIKYQLIQEGMHSENQLAVQAENLSKMRRELSEIQSVYANAQLVREDEKRTLVKKEEFFSSQRKNREDSFKEVRDAADSERSQTEKIAQKLQRVQLHYLMLFKKEAAKHVEVDVTQKRLEAFETLFDIVKDASGISEAQTLVSVIRQQKKTTALLRDKKARNEEKLERLRKMWFNSQTYYDYCYVTSEPAATREKDLAAVKQQVVEQQQNISSIPKKLAKESNEVFDTNAALQYLIGKLNVTKDHREDLLTVSVIVEPVPQRFSYFCLIPRLDEAVVDTLHNYERKLLHIFSHFKQCNLPALLEEMEEEFFGTIEAYVPRYNARIPIRFGKFDPRDDEGSGDDDNTVPTRASIKKRSQQIVDLKSKKAKMKKHTNRRGKM